MHNTKQRLQWKVCERGFAKVIMNAAQQNFEPGSAICAKSFERAGVLSFQQVLTSGLPFNFISLVLDRISVGSKQDRKLCA